MKVSPGGSYGVLALAPLEIAPLEIALASAARDSTSASAQELGKIGKFLHPHCLQVHKVQFFAI